MSTPDVAALFESLPHGRRITMETRGLSLWPLLRGGERLVAERCDTEKLRRGDVAVLRSPDGLVAHVVTSTRPLRTESFRGTPDPEGWLPLGRVVDGLPLNARRVLWLAQRAWSTAAKLRQLTARRRSRS